MPQPSQPLKQNPTDSAPPQTEGQVIRTPFIYELIIWAATLGKENKFRRFCADLVGLRPGQAVLDIGCGTGTMALLAKELVGKSGQVTGIEPALEMVKYAKRKAAHRHLAVDFQPGMIEQLNFPDQSFDVLLCIIVMHHMPDNCKIRGIREMARVLKPGGRLLVVDSDLNLLPSFENEGFVQEKTGPMPIVNRYDFAVWRLKL
jgi:ubiquinone/menaquinone biosynthesis C-methylase UbiE